MPVNRKQYAVMHFKNLINLKRTRKTRENRWSQIFFAEHFQ